MRLLIKLGLRQFGEMIGTRMNAVLGEFTLLRQYLAFAAFALAAADGFQIDTEPLRRLQYRGAHRDLPAQARRHEQHADFFQADGFATQIQRLRLPGDDDDRHGGRYHGPSRPRAPARENA